LLVSVFCFIMVGIVKPKLGYDDSLDAFGVHGIGGIWGALATGVFASALIQPGCSGSAHQLFVQFKAVGATIVYSGVLTFVLFKIVDKTLGIRATEEEESIGLDISQHEEIAYTEAE